MINRRKRNRAPTEAQNRTPILIGLLLFASTAWLFWPATQFPFVNFDDNLYVTDNAQIRQGLNWDTVRWAVTSVEASNWHPLTWLSHAADVSMWGVSPTLQNPSPATGHHRTNVLLHAVNAALAFGVFWQLTRHTWSCAFLAALFAWHPLRVESVAWIAERKDLLSGLFWLLAISGYAYYVRTKTLLGYGAVLTCFAAGLMSKPMVITLPFVLLLLDYWPLNRLSHSSESPSSSSALGSNGRKFRSGKKKRGNAQLPTIGAVALVREKLPLFGLVAVSACVTILAQWHGGSIVTTQLSLATRLANAVLAYWTYIRQTFWPSGLAVFYPYSMETWPGAELLLAGMMIALVTVGAVWTRKRLPFLAVGWLWFLGTLVPVIGLIQVGGQAHADRYTYLPSLGLAIMLAWGFPAAVARWQFAKAALPIILVAALLACLVATRNQLPHWRSSEALFTRAVEVSPHSGLAWSNLGAALSAEGRNTEAMHAYRKAVQLAPTLEARAGLASAVGASGDTQQAVDLLKALIREFPNDHKLANNLAWILATANAQHRDSAEAIRLAERAVELSKGADASILDTLAVAYAAGHRWEDAVGAAERAISVALDRGDVPFAEEVQSRRNQYQSLLSEQSK